MTLNKEATYVFGSHESILRSHKRRTVANSAAYLIPHLKPGLKLLDVGCGPGTITVDFANYVPGGDITGLEHDPAILAHARSHAANSELGTTAVSFVQGDAHALPFADATFDVVHAHQVLLHVADPVRALREMRRVARPGGLVAARDADLAAAAWFPDAPGLREWHALYVRVARACGGEPGAGRRLKSWARAAGFDPARVACSTATWDYTTPEQRAWQGAMHADRLLQSDFGKNAEKQGATREDLERLAQAWRAWGEEEDGWFTILIGEIVCHA